MQHVHLRKQNFSHTHPAVASLKKWIRQIFPADDMYSYFWKYMASMLYSGNGDKIFTGDGDNSKSMLIKLVQKALGDYCVKLPAGMLSEKEGHSSNANPCKAMANNAKLVVFDEPDDAEQPSSRHSAEGTCSTSGTSTRRASSR